VSAGRVNGLAPARELPERSRKVAEIAEIAEIAEGLWRPSYAE
jgi:hypothetical protein